MTRELRNAILSVHLYKNVDSAVQHYATLMTIDDIILGASDDSAIPAAKFSSSLTVGITQTSQS